MRDNLRCQLWIAAAAALIFFTNLGSVALFDMDEALYGSCAREMFQRGDRVVPWFNGEMFPEKPPLMFWTMMAGFELFGVNEFGARFFSAVLGIATALATFHLGRLLFGARVGCWAGLIVATTIIFTVSARAATVDMALTFATTAAFLLFAMAKRMAVNEEGSEFRVQGSASDATPGGWGGSCTAAPVDATRSSCARGGSTTATPTTGSEFDLRYAIPMYACIGVAVLGKGPVGMVLPLAAMGLYLLVVNGWRSALRSAWWMRPFTAIVVVAAVAVPWYVLVGVRTDGEWLRKFFIDFNLRPFKQPIQGHGGWLLSYLFHIPGVLFGFFPWAVFLGPTLVDTVQRLRREKGSELFLPEAETGPGPDKIVLTPFFGCVLASCWFGVWFVFWSICKTKLPHYLLPAYPALALLTACFVDRWLSGKGDWSILCAAPGTDRRLVGPFRQNGPVPFSAWWLRNAWISMILVGVGIMIAIPIVAAVYLPGEELLGLVGLIPALGGMWCWWKTARNRHQDAAVAFAVTSVVFLTTLFGFAALRIDRYQNAKPMIAAIRADWKARTISVDTVPFSAPPIATYRFFRESTVFYAGCPVTKCDNDEQAGRSAREELRAFVAQSGTGPFFGGRTSSANRPSAENMDLSPFRLPAYVITTDEYAAEIAAAFPGVFREILRQRRFLGPGEMVVLATSP